MTVTQYSRDAGTHAHVQYRDRPMLTCIHGRFPFSSDDLVIYGKAGAGYRYSIDFSYRKQGTISGEGVRGVVSLVSSDWNGVAYFR